MSLQRSINWSMSNCCMSKSWKNTNSRKCYCYPSLNLIKICVILISCLTSNWSFNIILVRMNYSKSNHSNGNEEEEEYHHSVNKQVLLKSANSSLITTTKCLLWFSALLLTVLTASNVANAAYGPNFYNKTGCLYAYMEVRYLSNLFHVIMGRYHDPPFSSQLYIIYNRGNLF